MELNHCSPLHCRIRNIQPLYIGNQGIVYSESCKTTGFYNASVINVSFISCSCFLSLVEFPSFAIIG
jgi:hypothetical protein